MSRSSYDLVLTDNEEDPVPSNHDTMSQHSNHSKIVFQIYSVKLKLGQLKYITFLITGVALLWPWNCFLSASEYFGERLEANATLASAYSSTMMTISTITSLICNFVIAQRQTGVDYSKRLKLGQLFTMLIFAIMGLSCIFQTDLEPGIYFTFIMLMVFLSAISVCFSQNGTMALVNVLGSIYANGVMVGQAVAGVLPSITLIISVLGSNMRKEAGQEKSPESNFGVLVYFFTACLVSAMSYGFFKLVEYFDDHSYQELLLSQEPIAMLDNSKNVNGDVDEDTSRDSELDRYHESEFNLGIENVMSSSIILPSDSHVSFSYLWKRLKLIVTAIFLTFAITLIFPVFASSVESTNNWKFVSKKVFVPFVFLIWNVGDLAGRVACAWELFKISNPRKLVAYSIARSLLVPFFFLCNVNNNGAIVDSDLFYILLQFVFGFSNGQLCSSCFMNVGQLVEGENEQKAAGGFTTIFLSSGLAFGSVMSYLFVWMINR